MIDKKAIKENNLSREDIIKIIMDVTGNDRAMAEFIYALETGEVDGDVIALDEKGNEIKVKQPPSGRPSILG